MTAGTAQSWPDQAAPGKQKSHRGKSSLTAITISLTRIIVSFETLMPNG